MAANVNFFNENDIVKAQELINNLNSNTNTTIKRVKKENGLIERTENNNKVILVEDNRQIILG